MNVNDQMHELATMGGRAYTPDASTISSLMSRTKRARGTRKSASALAGTVGALALGLVAAQVYAAAKNDPAFRDRNIINNNDNLTPIELYRAKYGQDNPTKSNGSSVDLTSIIDKLKAAAQTPQAPTAPIAPEKPAGTTTTTKPPATSTPKPPAGDGGSTCTTPSPAPAGATWDCTYSKWVPSAGYFLLGNGWVYQNVKWTDAATGLQAWGNWSGTSYGWETKAVFTSSSTDQYYDYYVYMGGNASWSGTTCSGGAMSKFNANFKASCMPESRVTAAGLSYYTHYITKYDLVWILQDTYKKWCPPTGQYEDPAAPPSGYTWDGSAWVAVAPPSP